MDEKKKEERKKNPRRRAMYEEGSEREKKEGLFDGKKKERKVDRYWMNYTYPGGERKEEGERISRHELNR